MKNKVIYLLVIAGICVFCMGLNNSGADKNNVRVHQHLQENAEIPVININTNGQVLNVITEAEKPDVLCDFSITDSSGEISTFANVHYRGNSSLEFDKKSYSIRLVDNNGNEDKRSLAGMSAHNEWVLNGPFLDKTLIRNYMCMNIAGEVMDYAPNVRYCELNVNGEYQGLYLLMETITRGDERLNLSKPENNSPVTSYVVHLERENRTSQILNNFSYYTYKTGNSAFDVRYPGTSLITEARMDYIASDISAIEKILYSYDIIVRRTDYADYIDMESFAEYFVINEFFSNSDAGWYSTYFYKDSRGKLKACVWDFNNCCDNFQELVTPVSGFRIHKAPWFEALVKDKRFIDAVVEKYRELRKGVLSEEYILNYIDETTLWISDEAAKNYEVWGYVWNPSIEDDRFYYNYLNPIERNPVSYEEAVQQLKDYIVNRGNWLDENIDDLYQYCHDSRNANEILR